MSDVKKDGQEAVRVGQDGQNLSGNQSVEENTTEHLDHPGQRQVPVSDPPPSNIRGRGWGSRRPSVFDPC